MTPEQKATLWMWIAWLSFVLAGIAIVVGVIIWAVKTGVKEGIRESKRKS